MVRTAAEIVRRLVSMLGEEQLQNSFTDVHCVVILKTSEQGNKVRRPVLSVSGSAIIESSG